MIVTFVLVAALLLVVAMVAGVALEAGPEPADVATAYELAWDRLDFVALWDLSAPELRDGLDREGFVAAKRAAYRDRPALRRLADEVAVDAVVADRRTAAVATRLELRDGGTVRNELRLARRHGRWQVVGYALRPEAA